uniref:Uncharacterized protein n=1 Tax=Avena sativa TaxID=4498 RepID=A0ACD6ARU1_AVESA
MAVVDAEGLAPLLPAPTSCVGLRPPPSSYSSSRFDGTRKPAGRASSSESWIRDKLTGGGVPSADRKMPDRASLSSSWVEDKKLGQAGTLTTSVERAGRPTWRGTCWSGGKRPASRAPSADQTERKQKTLIVKKEASPASTIAFETCLEAIPATKIAVETEAAPATEILIQTETARTPSIAIEMEAAPAPEMLFAGPSFIAVSPDPSELPFPSYIILRRLARVFAGYVIAELSSTE